MMALSYNQAGLLAWMFLLLSLSEIQSDCPRPDLPPHSSLKGGGPEDTYPTGTNLRLQCIPGYETIPGIIPRMTCHDTKWSDLPTLCQGKRCPVPSIDNGRILSSNDLRLGEEVTLGCNYGFRIIGGTTRQCVVRSDTVAWNRELPTCESIPCARPPVIANGIYDPSPSDVYDVGQIIIYRCDPNYSRIGNSVITCVVAENGVDGKWDFPLPECKSIPCARPPVIANGIYDPSPSDVYVAGQIVIYRCDPNYSLIGNSAITCVAAENGVDGKWDLPSPECKKKSLEDRLDIIEKKLDLILHILQLTRDR